ncbi:MAG: LLM class flavin-dependent oxidoreductase [Chloroflexi bacterium]|nr:LLM class flavin-dependent oxidoreductase [Chloroflexota bacterium]
MRFGAILLWGQDLREYLRLVKLTEELGYGLIGVGDSQSVYREVYVALAAAALHTSKALVGPMVTNPVTRHPAVTASAIASVDELAGGRAMLGIGSGASALHNVQERSAPLSYLREYVSALRILLRGEHVEWQGKKVHTQWVSRPVPVYMAAYGPQTLRMAGAIADGVIIATSALPEILAECLSFVRQGAEEAGRDPASLDIWAMVRGSVRDTREEAVADIKANLASAANISFRGDLHGKHLPPELEPKVRELQQRYANTEHVIWSGSNSQLIDDLGLTDYLADRFSIAGTPAQCRAKVRAIRDAGVHQIIVPAVDRDPENVIRRFATEVFPEFRRP